MRRRVLALCGVLVGLLGSALLLAAPALAHATVVGSDPVDGSRLTVAPHVVTITFDEPVALGGIGYLNVTNQQGTSVDLGTAYHPDGDGPKVAVKLEPHLPDGTYVASYRVISADSHPVAGAVDFVVGHGPLLAVTSTSTAATNAVTSTVFDVIRWVSYGGFALLGGFWLLATVWPEARRSLRARRLVWTGWAATTIGAACELLVQGPFSAGASLAKLRDVGLLDDTLHSMYGELHCVRLVLLGVLGLLIAATLADAAIARPAASGLTFAGIALSFSAAQHAATTSPAWLSVALDMAHLLAMAAWVGGLAMLAIALVPRGRQAELERALPVYSTVAFSSVVVLAVTGTYAAWRGIGALAAIFGTTYGLLVVGKIVLFVGLVGIGNLSRLLVQRHYRRPVIAYAMTDTITAAPAPQLVAPPTTAVPPAERLRRAVWVETVVGMVVLALTAVLVAQPRGKEALIAQYHQPITATAPVTSSSHAVVTASSGTHGNIDLTITVPPGIKRVTATATQHDADIGPLPVTLDRSGATRYSGTVDLSVAGTWDIDLTLTRSAFDAVTTDAYLHLH